MSDTVEQRAAEVITANLRRCLYSADEAGRDIAAALAAAGLLADIGAAQGVGIHAAFRVPGGVTDKHGCDPPCQHDIIAAAVDRLAASGPKEAT